MSTFSEQEQNNSQSVLIKKYLTIKYLQDNGKVGLKISKKMKEQFLNEVQGMTSFSKTKKEQPPTKRVLPPLRIHIPSSNKILPTPQQKQHKDSK